LALVRGLILTLSAGALLAGCGTVHNLTKGPEVYGGVRYDWHVFRNSDMESGAFAMWDLPFSLVLDTALLPVTAMFELIRWLTGWPPPHDFQN